MMAGQTLRGFSMMTQLSLDVETLHFVDAQDCWMDLRLTASFRLIPFRLQSRSPALHLVEWQSPRQGRVGK
jgi:hypothetical protein